MSQNAIDFESIHPRGATGRFAVKEKAESGAVALSIAPDRPRRRFAALDDWEPDYTHPLPQANDIEKVITVPRAVENGAVTGDAVAEAFGIHTREGGYYLNAAAFMGLVRKRTDDGIDVYETTSLGQAMSEADEDTRAEMTSQMIEAIPEVQTLVDEDEQTLVDDLRRAGLADSTAQRRAASLRSWLNATDDRHGLASAMGLSSATVTERSGLAAARAQQQRDDAKSRVAARYVEKPVAVCTSCFMALPSTGLCDDCG